MAWKYRMGWIPGRHPGITTPQDFRDAVAAFLAERDDGTTPDRGWPWPWNDSQTTDYAYALDGGKVWGAYFGHEWFDATQPEPESCDDNGKVATFPDMRRKRNQAEPGTSHSGVMVVGFGSKD